jgi:hypothetical protein
MKIIAPASIADWNRVNRACELLREARDLLSKAKAPRATDKVRRALKSSEGALRHVQHRCNRTGKQS